MFKPTQDYILVKPIERKQSDILWVTPEKYSRGLVIAVGPGERMTKNGQESGRIRPMCVKPGDFITYGDLDWIFPKYHEDGIEYRILQDKDVTFISEREFIDEHNHLSDAQIDELLSKHRHQEKQSLAA